jgi:hypothetical protein
MHNLDHCDIVEQRNWVSEAYPLYIRNDARHQSLEESILRAMLVRISRLQHALSELGMMDPVGK